MPTVDRTAVNQMIVGRLIERLVDIEVYAPNEEPSGNDNAWCKVHRVSVTPLQSTPGADHRALSFTISVCVDADAGDASPHALDNATQTVLEAIEHASVAHADGVHRLQLHDAESDILTEGEHDADATGVVAVTGNATRTHA